MRTETSESVNLQIIRSIKNKGILGATAEEIREQNPFIEDLDFRLNLLSYQGILTAARYIHTAGTIYYLTRDTRSLLGTDKFNGMLNKVHVPVDVTIDMDEDEGERLITCRISDNALLTPDGWRGEDIVAYSCGGDSDSLISEVANEFEESIPEWLRGSIIYDVSELDNYEPALQQ